MQSLTRFAQISPGDGPVAVTSSQARLGLRNGRLGTSSKKLSDAGCMHRDSGSLGLGTESRSHTVKFAFQLPVYAAVLYQQTPSRSQETDSR
jgi:hypothetical protein